jgi:hypothetical protein
LKEEASADKIWFEAIKTLYRRLPMNKYSIITGQILQIFSKRILSGCGRDGGGGEDASVYMLAAIRSYIMQLEKASTFL